MTISLVPVPRPHRSLPRGFVRGMGSGPPADATRSHRLRSRARDRLQGGGLSPGSSEGARAVSSPGRRPLSSASTEMTLARRRFQSTGSSGQGRHRLSKRGPISVDGSCPTMRSPSGAPRPSSSTTDTTRHRLAKQVYRTTPLEVVPVYLGKSWRRSQIVRAPDVTGPRWPVMGPIGLQGPEATGTGDS